MPTGDIVTKSAEEVTKVALEKSGYSMGDLDFVVSTGYARHNVQFADKAVSEIICHARGVHYLLPEVKTIIDIGGQDSKVISLREDGTVNDFVMNDKCAAGTGRFLEVMATVLNTTIDQMGTLSLNSICPSQITNTCTIFAETEVIGLRAEMIPREDIIAGLHRAVAQRVVLMGRSVGFRPKVVFSGGVAMNKGVLMYLEESIKMPIVVSNLPQVMGSLGAALMATEAKIGTCYQGRLQAWQEQENAI